MRGRSWLHDLYSVRRATIRPTIYRWRPRNAVLGDWADVVRSITYLALIHAG